MKRLFYTLLFFLPCMLIACGGSDDTPDGDNNPPVVAPPSEEPVDSRLLYNGIRLPNSGRRYVHLRLNWKKECHLFICRINLLLLISR